MTAAKSIKIKTGKESTAENLPATPAAPKKEPAPGKIKLHPVVSVYEDAFPELQQVINEKTGSIFSVIGTTPEGLQISIRVYLAKSDPGFTRMDFRLRIGDLLPNAPKLGIPVPSVIESKYPALWGAVAESSKGSGVHVSVEGAILIPCDPWEKEALKTMVGSCDLAADLSASLVASIPGVALISPDHLRFTIRDLAEKAIKDVAIPKYATAQKSVQWRVGLTTTPLVVKTATTE